MNAGTRKRRVDRALALADPYETNARMIAKTVWQDEKDFPLHVPVNTENDRVYHKGKFRIAISLNKETKKQSKKVMVSAGITWYGATRAFFVGEKGV